MLFVVCAALVQPSAAIPQGTVAQLMFKPKHAFSQEATPPPNGSSRTAWAALPDDTQRAPADDFFLHPTTYLSPAGWNAAFDDPGAGGFGVEGALRGQASVFARCCRIFAPRYRQATLYAFLDYSLFYENLRVNAAARSEALLSRR